MYPCPVQDPGGPRDRLGTHRARPLLGRQAGHHKPLRPPVLGQARSFSTATLSMLIIYSSPPGIFHPNLSFRQTEGKCGGDFVFVTGAASWSWQWAGTGWRLRATPSLSFRARCNTDLKYIIASFTIFFYTAFRFEFRQKELRIYWNFRK